MQTEHILSLLIHERDGLNRAIEVLQGPAKRRGRPPKNAFIVAPAAPKKRKAFNAATRKKMALAQKRRWAALKTAK
jgi:hypothetical protein